MMANAVNMQPRIEINEHSSICLVGNQGTVAYVDPFHVPAGSRAADVVCITHSHYDHYDPESLAHIATAATQFACPADVAQQLADAGVSADCIHVLAAGAAQAVCGVSIEAVAAYNMNKDFHPKANGWLGYVLTVDGARVYVVGDSDATPEAIGVHCDIICVPVGGTYTTTALEAAQLVAAMNPRPQLAVPEHYGTVAGGMEAGIAFRRALADLAPGVQVALPYGDDCQHE